MSQKEIRDHVSSPRWKKNWEKFFCDNPLTEKKRERFKSWKWGTKLLKETLGEYWEEGKHRKRKQLKGECLFNLPERVGDEKRKRNQIKEEGRRRRLFLSFWRCRAALEDNLDGKKSKETNGIITEPKEGKFIRKKRIHWVWIQCKGHGLRKKVVAIM